MGKKLAIRGHSTRGKEVIELLEMIGGSNSAACGYNEDLYYFIGVHNIIDADNLVYDSVIIFNLEEFLEKYPFKVGDKVIDVADGCPGVVSEMKWDADVLDMKYCVVFGNGIDFGWFANSSIEFCKDNKTLEKTKVEYPGRNREDVLFDSIIWHLRNSVNNGKQNLSGGECEEYFREVVKKNNENKMKNVIAELLEHIKTTSKEDLEREFEEIKEWSNVGPTVEEFMDFCDKINKKPKYPTTYKECCDVLSITPYYNLRYHTYEHGYTEYAVTPELCSLQDKLNTLGKLLICRYAYWKIVGEQMGLDKPWRPTYETLVDNTYFTIHTFNGEIVKSGTSHRNSILAFPTEEMRDAFYENFKDLIEHCKELL